MPALQNTDVFAIPFAELYSAPTDLSVSSHPVSLFRLRQLPDSGTTDVFQVGKSHPGFLRSFLWRRRHGARVALYDPVQTQTALQFRGLQATRLFVAHRSRARDPCSSDGVAR